jgi:hypothetical protein
METRLSVPEYNKLMAANKDKSADYQKRYNDIQKKIHVRWYKLQDNRHTVMHFKIPSEKSKLMYDTLIEFYTEYTDSNSLRRCEIKVFSNCPSWVFMNARVAHEKNMDISWANGLFNKETLKPPEEGKEVPDNIRLEKGLCFAIIHLKSMNDITLMSKARNAIPIKNGDQLSYFIRNSDWIMEKRGQYKSDEEFKKLLQKFSPVKISNAQTKRAGMSTSKTITTTKVSSSRTKSVAKTKKI